MNLGLKVTEKDIEAEKLKRKSENQQNREIYERIFRKIIDMSTKSSFAREINGLHIALQFEATIRLRNERLQLKC